MTDRAQHSLAQFTAQDGTSNTLTIGELVGASNCGIPTRNFAWAWMGYTNMPTGWGMQDPCQWYTYGSKHSGVVQFAYGDGSVRGVSRRVPFATLVYASGWQDGVVYDANLLTN